jgi:subtilisin family serine protease
VAILDQSTVAILDQKNSPLVLNQSTVAILDQSTVAILDGQQLPEDFGHGTMVSGLIHLVAPTASIMPLKAFQSDGTAELSNIVAAIYCAVDHGARVINMSFSTTTKEPVLQQAIAYTTSHGVICIASAGNQGREMTVYPAGFQGVIGVASTNKNDLRSPFSNYDSDAIRLAAPGEALVTTCPGNNYAAVWGTSFSSALVSGASALVTDVVPLATSGYATQAFDQVRISTRTSAMHVWIFFPRSNIASRSRIRSRAKTTNSCIASNIQHTAHAPTAAGGLRHSLPVPSATQWARCWFPDF